MQYQQREHMDPTTSWKARHNTDNQCKYQHKDSMVYQSQYSGPW